MAESVSQETEAHLAKERNKNLADSLIGERTRYISLAVLLIVLSAIIAVIGLWMIALASLVLGLIFLLQYFDANGHLHEVQRRSSTTLVRDFSVLRRADGESSTKPRPASH